MAPQREGLARDWLSIRLRLLTQPYQGSYLPRGTRRQPFQGRIRKNPQELVRGLSREIGILVSPLDDDEDVLVFLDFLFGYHRYWTRQMYVGPHC